MNLAGLSILYLPQAANVIKPTTSTFYRCVDTCLLMRECYGEKEAIRSME